MTDVADTAAETRRHELLADVAETVAHRLIGQHGLAQDTAIDVGNDLADFLAGHWRGQNIYIVGDRPFKLNQRDWEIYRRMQRGNAHELAAEYKISFVRVHQIHKRCLAEARRRVQDDLFGPDEPSDEQPDGDPADG
jgi:Mor family transcriptional regulator